MCVCVCVCVRACVCVGVGACRCGYGYVGKCVFVCVYVGVCVGVCVWLYVCVWGCGCVWGGGGGGGGGGGCDASIRFYEANDRLVHTRLLFLLLKVDVSQPTCQKGVVTAVSYYPGRKPWIKRCLCDCPESDFFGRACMHACMRAFMPAFRWFITRERTFVEDFKIIVFFIR